MAEIIGYSKIVHKQYKVTCWQCGAIIVFDESETKSEYSRPGEEYRSAICPGCLANNTFDVDECTYNNDKQTDYFEQWPPRTSNCIRNCSHCQAKCVYRKVKYQNPKDE